MPDLETSRKQSAHRQIEAAIQFFHNGKIDCAITLAAAAENMLPRTNEPHIFQILSPYNDDLQINLVINWLKHPNEPETATISEFEAAIVITRAISKFIAVHHQSCQPFNDFLRWGHRVGHLPNFDALRAPET